jgi:O-succinylbenzoate synthase
VAAAERWAADGFSTFKLKLGGGDEAAQVRAVREALGPRAQIRIDVNGAWDVDTAKRTLGELEPYEVELAEQPVATLEEAMELARSTSIPIAGDESIESRADAERAAAMEACQMTGVKLSKVGGPEEAIEIAEVLPAYISSALDGPVGIAAAAQVAATLGEAGGGGPDLAHRHAAPLRLDDRLGRVPARGGHAARARRAWPWRRDRRRRAPGPPPRRILKG